MMRQIWPWVVFGFALGLAGKASAQATDFLIIPSGGQYALSAMAPTDPDVVRVCVERVDIVPVEELGCVDVIPGQVATLTISIGATPGDDAEVRGFAYDSSGNKSGSSPNMAVADFSAPGAPTLVP